MRYITLQPSAHTNQITAGGIELQKLPTAIHVNPDGSVQRQDFWKGDVALVIGFCGDPFVESIDLLWEECVNNPQQAVGMYLVTADEDDEWSTHINAITTVTVHEDA